MTSTRNTAGKQHTDRKEKKDPRQANTSASEWGKANEANRPELVRWYKGLANKTGSISGSSDWKERCCNGCLETDTTQPRRSLSTRVFLKCPPPCPLKQKLLEKCKCEWEDAHSRGNIVSEDEYGQFFKNCVGKIQCSGLYGIRQNGSG